MSSFLTLLLAKTTLVLLLGAAVAALLRSRSAATRHLVWTLTLFGTLLVAVTATVAPPVTLAIPVVEKTIAKENPALEHRHPAGPSAGFEPAPARTPVDRPAGSRSSVPLLWLAGFLGVLGWPAIGHIGLAFLARSAKDVTGASWRAMIGDRRVRVALSEAVSAPITWGWMNPVILLPSGAESWPLDRRRAALMHELAHVDRRDYVTQLLAGLICAVYWFHPLVWVAQRRLRSESEHACDDYVLSGGAEAPEYASHLLDVARGAGRRRLCDISTLGMARPSELEGRVVAVLDGARKRSFVSPRARIATALLVTLALVPFAVARPVLTRVLNVQATEPVQPIEERMINASAGETLRLDLETGASVDIRGWDEPRVSVRGQQGGQNGADVRIDVARHDRGVRVHTTYAKSSQNQSSHVQLAIRVPRKFDVRIESAGGGITIRDVAGSFIGSTGGGEIVLEKVEGRAELSTGGGEIHVDDVNLDGHVSTGGGKVSLQRVRGNLHGTSGSGPVMFVRESDGALGKIGASAGRLHVEKAGGEVTLDEVPNGATVSTGGGRIRIGRGAGLVEASTGGGGIVVGPIAGSVHANTGAGRVEITLADAGGDAQSVEVFSGKGRVTVNLPSGYDGQFDLETAYTETHRRTQIDSDWSLSQEETRVWDEREGTPRKYIRARGTAGSGAGRVRVKTVNGDIFIRRAD